MPPKKVAKKKAGEKGAAVGKGKDKVKNKGKTKASAAKATSTRVETAEGSHVVTNVKVETTHDAVAVSIAAPITVSASAPEAAPADVAVSKEVFQEEQLDPVDEIADPWQGISIDDQWRCVAEEDAHIICGECGDSVDDLLAQADSKVWFKLGECELESFVLDDMVRSKVIALDLSNNSLSEGIQAPENRSLSHGCAWLRYLSLQANPISKCPDLKPYAECLLWLDLSFCECNFRASGEWARGEWMRGVHNHLV